MSLRHSLVLRALFAVTLCALLALFVPLPAQAQAPAASDAAATAAVPPPVASTSKETIDNPYGLSALWAQGDFVAKGTLIILVIIMLIYRSTPRGRSLVRLAFALVLAGAIGNLIDRLRFDEVVDFLDVHWYQYHWPAFNIADFDADVEGEVYQYRLWRIRLRSIPEGEHTLRYVMHVNQEVEGDPDAKPVGTYELAVNFTYGVK